MFFKLSINCNDIAIKGLLNCYDTSHRTIVKVLRVCVYISVFKWNQVFKAKKNLNRVPAEKLLKYCESLVIKPNGIY